MRRTRNAKYGQPYRGFESLPLRHPPPILRFSATLQPLPTLPFDEDADRSDREVGFDPF